MAINKELVDTSSELTLFTVPSSHIKQTRANKRTSVRPGVEKDNLVKTETVIEKNPIPLEGKVVQPGADPSAVFGRPEVKRRDTTAYLIGAVDVLVDGYSKLGPLAYNVPNELNIRPGDAVEVPFGKKTCHGLVVSSAQFPQKATRDIIKRFGVRADPSDVALALSVSRYHFTSPAKALDRLAPKTGKGAAPSPVQPVTISAPAKNVTIPVSSHTRRLYVTAPKHNQSVLVAAEANRLLQFGQVLIICPTAAEVETVLANIPTGAVRLDTKASRGDWSSFCEGLAQIGVGTRAAVLYAGANLGSIIVVAEDHLGHTEPRAPHTNARDLASARSRALKLHLSLFATTPSTSGMYAVGEVISLTDTQAGMKGWPAKILLADRTGLDPAEALIPPRMRSAIRRALKKGQTPVVVSSRDVALRRCVSCLAPHPCTQTSCKGVCRHTGDPCPACSSTAGVRLTGWDPARLSALLGSGVKVVTPKTLSKLSNVPLLILFDVDVLLAAPDWVPEKLAARAISLAAAATAEDGELVIATTNPKVNLLRDVVARKDLIGVTKRGLTVAKLHTLPPFGRIVTITLHRKSKPNVVGWPHQVLGPVSVGDGIWQVTVRVPTSQLASLEPYVLPLLKKSTKSRVEVK